MLPLGSDGTQESIACGTVHPGGLADLAGRGPASQPPMRPGRDLPPSKPCRGLREAY